MTTPPPTAPGGPAGPRPSNEAYVAALAALEAVGPARLGWLLAAGTPPEVWRRLAEGSLHPPGEGGPRIDRGRLEAWGREVRTRRDLPRLMGGRLHELGLEVRVGETVPARLRAEPDPAPAVFLRGRLPSPDTPMVAVVGTRRASSYGLRIAAELGRDLSASGVGVVSGLALGIDAAAHSGMCDADVPDPGAAPPGGPPVAVIGSGHDRPCPSRNRALARRLSDRGALLGEVPPGVPSAPWRYPARNRLIAALADVVVVVESPSAGGSMSTVAEALARDRSVMAVPGPLGRRSSEGCHDLLRDGAEICTGADDVLTLLGLAHPGDGPPDAAAASTAELRGDATGAIGAEGGRGRAGTAAGAVADPVERAVLDALVEGPLTPDVLIGRCGHGFSEVSAALGSLVARDLVERRGGWVERRR